MIKKAKYKWEMIQSFSIEYFRKDCIKEHHFRRDSGNLQPVSGHQLLKPARSETQK